MLACDRTSTVHNGFGDRDPFLRLVGSLNKCTGSCIFSGLIVSILLLSCLADNNTNTNSGVLERPFSEYDPQAGTFNNN